MAARALQSDGCTCLRMASSGFGLSSCRSRNPITFGLSKSSRLPITSLGQIEATKAVTEMRKVWGDGVWPSSRGYSLSPSRDSCMFGALCFACSCTLPFDHLAVCSTEPASPTVCDCHSRLRPWLHQMSIADGKTHVLSVGLASPDLTCQKLGVARMPA